jgi:hypothetical protein
MDVHVRPIGTSIEPYLLHGAAHVPAAFARIVAWRHSRVGFAAAFADAMRYVAVNRKSSRASILWKIGKRMPISVNPLDGTSKQ